MNEQVAIGEADIVNGAALVGVVELEALGDVRRGLGKKTC